LSESEKEFEYYDAQATLYRDLTTVSSYVFRDRRRFLQKNSWQHGLSTPDMFMQSEQSQR